MKKSADGFLRLEGEKLQPVEQDAELQALAEEIREEYERRREERRPIELNWRLNQNFLMGNQYCDIVEETGELIDSPAGSEWENRSVYNMIAPIVETRLAKLGRVRPGLTVRPLTEDAADVSNAKLATRLLRASYAAQDLPGLQQAAGQWAEICGSVFYKTVWNPRGGCMIGWADGHPVYEGDISTAVVPAYEIFPDCCCREGVENQESIIHAKVYGVKEIETLWGVRVEGRTLDVFGTDAMSLAGGGYHPQFGMNRTERMEDAELVIEYYERPGAQHQEGRHIIVAGGYVVHVGELPFVNGENGKRGYPLIQQFCLTSPGNFFGCGVIERLIPLQRDYNAINNRINEYTARMTAGNLVAEQGALVNEELLDTGIAPGTVIEYRAGATPPGWMPVSEIPGSLLARLADMRKEFVDISGVSEMAKASTTSGSISSGVALEILREQDDTRLSITAEHIRSAVRELGQHWLRLLRQFAVGARLTRTAGEDMAATAVLHWRRGQLTSDDVQVDTDNELSNTPAQRRQLALELMHAGLFLDPDTQQLTRESRARLMEIFRLGNWEDLTGTDELQRSAAQLEHCGLERGIIPKIQPLDDHQLHLSEHTRYVLSAEFRQMQEENPRMAQALQMHAEGHKALAEDQAAHAGKAVRAM